MLGSREIVYFIQRESDSAIKIGISTNIYSRFQTPSAEHGILKMLGWVMGGRQTEIALHNQFVEFHKEGEWFDSSPELLSHIRNNACPLDANNWPSFVFECWQKQKQQHVIDLAVQNELAQLRLDNQILREYLQEYGADLSHIRDRARFKNIFVVEVSKLERESTRGKSAITRQNFTKKGESA